MNEIIKEIFDDVLKKDIYDELITYNDMFKTDKETFGKIIENIINEKYDFKIEDPFELSNLKNKYELLYSKRPKGRLANNIEWLNKQIGLIECRKSEKYEIMESRIDVYEPKYISREKFKKKKNRCMARLWNDHYGGQCSCSKKNGDYCIKHSNMIKKYGVLRFGRIDEIKPLRDNINNNKLHWKD